MFKKRISDKKGKLQMKKIKLLEKRKENRQMKKSIEEVNIYENGKKMKNEMYKM